MRPETQRGPVRGASADAFSADRAAVNTTACHPAQLLDELGHRLPGRRSAITGQPRRATPGWYRWAAADRWREVVP
jgi:hypothetical protein